jgi:predicted histidine transporter YuiF (NhaC family)
MIATFLKTMVAFLACLVVGDVIGVVVCVVIDVAPLRHGSAILPYAIWLVLGAFAGFVAFGFAGAWSSASGNEKWVDEAAAPRIGNIVLLSSLILVLVLCGIFYWLNWSRGVVGEYFVPDSMKHTLTYLLAALGAMLAARSALKPMPA